MDILIIGNGGREDALAKSLLKSDKIETIYISPQVGFSHEQIKSINIDVSDLEALRNFALEKHIDLTIVGPELPLNIGIVDFFKEKGLKIFGPDKKSAYLEGSKDFSKEFMEEYGIPTARYERFDDYDEARSCLGIYGYPQVIKADGLCAGKGVYICKDPNEAEEALKEIFLEDRFGDEASKIIVEDYIDGPEVSLLCFVSGNKIYPMDTAMDYKKIGEGDRGPNTGGVGCISPNPYWTDKLQLQSDEIIKRIEKGLEDRDLGYSGILFIGYIIDGSKLKVLEFNTRFGDPETEVLLPRLESSLLDNIMDSLEERPVKMAWSSKKAVGVILTSKGYPLAYESGYEIKGLDRLDQDLILYHNGTRLEGKSLQTNGGRVLSLLALGENLEEARNKVYENIKKIECSNLTYRKDIARLGKKTL